jgi:hypothetical protein
MTTSQRTLPESRAANSDRPYKWTVYEQEKRALKMQNLRPDEYDRKLQELCDRLRA